MELKLKRKIKVNSVYKAKTKFEFWTNMKIDDILEISLPINQITTQGYAPRLKIKNITQNKWSSGFTLTETYKYLKNIDYIIYEENTYSLY